MKVNKKDIKELLDFIEKEEEDMRWYDTSPYKLIDKIKEEVKNLLHK